MTHDHTIVVLAYEENPALEPCIASLKAQTVTSRLIMATSTPNRHITEIAERHGLPLLVNPQKAGIAGDFNFGLTAAPSRYITLAHQDDIYLPDFTKRTFEALAQAEDAAIAFARASEIDGAGMARQSKVLIAKNLLLSIFAGRRTRLAGLRARLLLSFGNPVSCSSVTFDRQRIPQFRFEQGLAANLDWAAWVSLMRDGHAFAYIPDVIIARRYDERTATSRLIRDGSRAREDRQIFERLWSKPVASILARVYAFGY